MPSLLRPASFFALALATLVAGCDESETEPVYFGVVDASALPDSALPDASPDAPQIKNLVVSECAQQPLIQGPDETSVVRFAAARLASLEGEKSTLVLTVHDGINAYEMDANGCPAQPVTAFGGTGHVAIDAIAAVPFGSNTLIATPERTIVLNHSGAEEATCAYQGADVRMRWLAPNAETLGVFVHSPIAVFTHGEAGPCNVMEWIDLELSPEFVLALTPVSNGTGFLAIEQSAASSPIAVSHYDWSGKRMATSPAQAGAPTLCSVTGLADTPKGILVADGACKQLVLYDGTTLQAIGHAALNGSPRGLAWPGGTKVMVPIAYATESGAEASFAVVDLAL